PRTGHPASGTWRPGTPGAVRHPGRGAPAEVRAVHYRSARRGIRPVRGAPAARGVRVHRYADRDHRQAAETPGTGEVLTARARRSITRTTTGCTWRMSLR